MNPRRFLCVRFLACVFALVTGSVQALTVNFAKAGQAPAITASSYTPGVGVDVYFTLGFAPQPGSSFIVVNNTGLAFINGEFQNLHQGDEVQLAYGGLVFKYVANYFGGTGNDLVLEWKGAHAVSWGGNGNGDLGRTGSGPLPAAVDSSGVLANKTVIGLAAGQNFSLALCSDGTVAAWGLNANGQLGNNGTSGSNVPVAVDLTGVLFGKRVIALAAGNSHSLALCSDGTVASWGENANGQLGNNDSSRTASFVPVLVSQQSGVSALAGKKVVAIAAGDQSSMALCSDGTVVAWGNGWLGNLSTSSTSLVPVRTLGLLFSPLTGRSIASGFGHGLCIASSNYLLAWGVNSYGQLGDQSHVNRGTPIPVFTYGTLLSKTFAAVTAGWQDSLVLCSDGTLAAWGDNYFGQLGNGSSASSDVPVPVLRSGPALAGKTVTSISSGAFHHFALCSDGTLAAWGRNGLGQLGDGTTVQRNSPVAVSMSNLAVGDRFVQATSGPLASDQSLAIVASLPDAPAIALHQGNGTGGALIGNASATPEAFPNTPVGSSSAAQTFTIQNVGTQPLTLALALGSPDFTLDTTGLVSPLAPNATTSFKVTFSPASAGTRTASATITTSDPYNLAFSLPLIGWTQTLGFETSGQSQVEDVVTVKIPVQLSQPFGAAFTVPVTFGGSAVAGHDYVASTASLTFTATQTIATLSVAVKDDNVVTGDRTVTITLGQPSVPGVALGANKTFTLTILEDDVPPAFTTLPVSQLVAVGSSVSFTAVASGSPPITLQWKKGTAAVAGATGGTFTATSSAKLTDAAAYTVSAHNEKATTSEVAQLGVVDTSDYTLRINPNGTATITAGAAGNGLRYQWLDSLGHSLSSGGRISGATSRTLVIKTLIAADSGSYTCQVTLPKDASIPNDLTLTTGTFALEVPNAAPALLTLAFPDSVAYNLYSYQIPFDTTASMAPTHFTCTGLPAGLVCNAATGLVTGRPTRTGSFSINVTASNSSGPSTSASDTMVVSSYPATAVGVYVGEVARHFATNGSLGGRVDLATTSTGSFTGSLHLGAAAYTLKGSMVTAPTAGAHPQVLITIRPAGQTPLLLNLDLDPSTNALSGTLNVQGDVSTAAITGWRNTWHTTAPANAVTDQLGKHAFELEPVTPGVAGEPQGYGFGTVTVTAAGATTVSGRTADGGAVLCSGVLSATGDVLVYLMLSSNKASLLGEEAIASGGSHTVSGSLDWQRTLVSTSVRDYAPFGPMALKAQGGLYALATPVLGLTAATPPVANAQLTFTAGGVESSLTNPDVAVYISGKNVMSVLTGTANPGHVGSLVLTASTGAFSGKFTLTDNAVTRSGIVFQGQIVPSLGKGYGFFLLPQLGTPSATTPILSGAVVLEP